jgi:hypothetical protein
MPMRALAAVVLALIVCAPVFARSQSAHLRISHASPVTAKGIGFKSREFVKVTLKMGHLKKVHGARASATGTFSVKWPGISIQNCDWSITAVGGHGSRASLHSNPATCQSLPPFDG